MKILNARRSTLLFKMDNNDVMRLEPGKVSTQFVGTVPILTSVIAAGTPDEIGIVISSSYEMDLLRKVPAALQYVFQTEQQAIDKLINGKDFTEVVDDNPYSIELKKLQDQLTKKDIEVKALNEKIQKMNDELENSEASRLREELTKRGQELMKTQTLVKEKEVELENTRSTLVEVEKSLHTKESEYNAVTKELLETQAKLEQDIDAEAIAEESQLVASLRKKVEELSATQAPALTNEQMEAINNYDQALQKIRKLETEISQLKTDGATLADKYNKAREASLQIMAKFNIVFDKETQDWIQKSPVA